MATARRAARKIVDETSQVRCSKGMGLIREEVWEDSEGQVVRYNLAFIHHRIFAGDNGRVLGYDTAHGYAHRHYMGTVEAIELASYEDVLERFIAEVEELRWHG
jgi:hypothetical protein